MKSEEEKVRKSEEEKVRKSESERGGKQVGIKKKSIVPLETRVG